MLGIGRSTLYLCIAEGQIETIKVGRSTLVPVDSLKAFVAARRSGAEQGTGAEGGTPA
jgi:excisionase family DNA binding protein